MIQHEIVVVGGGLASARAVKSYREAGGTGSVFLVTLDEVLPYHRPPLSKRYLRGEAEESDTLVEQPDFYTQHEVDVSFRTRVELVDLEAREIDLSAGARVGYEQLVIATGAAPRRLGVPGEELENVFTLRTLADSTAIRSAARGAKRAVVVGASFIGMEVASSLTALGIGVTLVHRGSAVFETLRAPEVSLAFADIYREKGVELVLEDEVVEFLGDGKLRAARTRSGRELEAELAVVGIGVEPLVAFLEGSGLTLDDGVAVDEHYRTGVPGVYAVGDVASFLDPIFERRRRIEHWSNANYQGTQVGKVLAGEDASYERVSTFFSEVFGTTIKVFGDIDQHDELVWRGSPRSWKAIGFYLAGGRLVATFVTGQDEETEARLQELILHRAEVEHRDRLADESAALEAGFRS
jgi:NTE family protein